MLCAEIQKQVSAVIAQVARDTLDALASRVPPKSKTAEIIEDVRRTILCGENSIDDEDAELLMMLEEALLEEDDTMIA